MAGGTPQRSAWRVYSGSAALGVHAIRSRHAAPRGPLRPLAVPICSAKIALPVTAGCLVSLVAVSAQQPATGLQALHGWEQCCRQLFWRLCQAVFNLGVDCKGELRLAALQEADWEVVRHFPPLTLAQLKAQRGVLVSYSRTHPVSPFFSAHSCELDEHMCV